MNGKENDNDRKKLPRSFVVIASVLIALIVLLAVFPFSKSIGGVDCAPVDLDMRMTVEVK